MTNRLPSIEIETAPNPQAAVIWMHGLGADGNDFAGVVPQLRLQNCPAIRFIFPHAPSMPVTVNGGYVMPAWYDIFGSNLVAQQDAKGIKNSEQAISDLIAHEIERGIPSQKIVLAGFSQGCAMALHTGLRYPQTLAGIIAMSGYLPLANTVSTERGPANSKTPIWMAHGIFDPVVIIDRGIDSRDALIQLNYSVEWKTYPMEHSVHPQELVDLSQFLTQVLQD